MQANLIQILTVLQEAESHGHAAGPVEPLNPLQWLTVIPFAAILLCIAIVPLVNEHWWEPNKHKAIIAAVLGIPMGTIYFFVDNHRFLHTLHEYISFICLLGALFIISGGIHIRGTLAGSPISNAIILLIGAVLASFIGTTGAAMVLVRPLLRSILWRRKPHVPVIFFTFLVANIGGLLTPLGDPPLFLGFLNGVPFTWTFSLWREWAFMVAIVIIVYLVLDTIFYRQDLAHKPEGNGDTSGEAFKIEGALNFLWLGGVLCTTAFIQKSPGLELGYILMSVIAWFTTKAEIREKNQFTFHPINEVAILFAGIFACMIPCLKILQEHGSELGVSTPAQFFWATGFLSSFLDNAPTYLTFFSMAKSFGIDEVAGVAHNTLVGISLGAVFMGANTYIGNGPNFMVKAIAEEWKVKMPSFFGYMAWSVCILVPLFVLVHFIFLAGVGGH